MFKVLGMYNFGTQVNNFQKFPFVCHFIGEFAHFDRTRGDKISHLGAIGNFKTWLENVSVAKSYQIPVQLD